MMWLWFEVGCFANHVVSHYNCYQNNLGRDHRDILCGLTLQQEEKPHKSLAVIGGNQDQIKIRHTQFKRPHNVIKKW